MTQLTVTSIPLDFILAISVHNEEMIDLGIKYSCGISTSSLISISPSPSSNSRSKILSIKYMNFRTEVFTSITATRIIETYIQTQVPIQRSYCKELSSKHA